MMAMIDAGKKKMNRPETRLTMAFPLVSAEAPGITDGPAGLGGPATEAAAESRPQTRQNRSPSAMLFPQAAQNEAISNLQRHCRDFPKFGRNTTLRLARRQSTRLVQVRLSPACLSEKVRHNGRIRIHAVLVSGFSWRNV